MSELDGKVAVITGAGSGMGRASTRVFVREGARVLAADISGREEETAAGLGDAVVAFRCDVTREEQVEAMFAGALAAFGKVDAVLNVAGIGAAAPLAEVTTDATTEALIGYGATTIASGGQIHVEAHSANTAFGHDEAAAGGIAAGAINWPSADVNGHTKATFDGNVTSGSSILVEATGANFADAESFVVGVGAIALGGAKAEANVNGTADIQALAGSTAGANVSGSVQIKATGSNIATAKTQGTSIGVVSLNIFAPITKVDAGVKATYDGGITSAGSLKVKARGQNISFAHAYMFSLSIIGGGGSLPEASLGANADTEASIGSTANITVTNAVTVDAGQNAYVADTNPVLGHNANFVGETNLAFAQSVVETASFSVAAGNNYSGMGVCDSCTGGYSFPTPLDGVRAQMQLLRNYADPDARATVLGNPPSPSLYGADPRKAAATYDSFFLKGKAQAYQDLCNLPALQEAMDAAERDARAGGEREEDVRPGIWNWLRERYGSGARG